ncbi:MAG: 3'-5' exonuclease [Roseovarius sp.]
METLFVLGCIAALIWYFFNKNEKNEPNSTENVPLQRKSTGDGEPSSSKGSPIGKQSNIRAPAVAKRQAKPFSFCALDTETTGIVPRSLRHRAFEISAVIFTPSGDGLKYKKSKFTRYIKVDTRGMKGLKLSPMWESHLSSGGQREAVDAFQALSELKDFAGGLPFVCHNTAFDKCVIENEIEKCSHTWKPSNKWICTLRMARSSQIGKYVGYSPGREDGRSYKLEHVVDALDLPFDTSKLHLGHYDAEIAGTVFLKMYHARSVPIWDQV